MQNLFKAIKGVHYPAVQATWPSRAIRRLLKAGQPLPTEWAMYFSTHPEYRDAVMRGG